jgi:hypothetical protein
VLCEPAEIRLRALEQTGHRINQQRKRRTLSEATRVTQGQEPFHPAIALLTSCPLAPFTPQHPEAMAPLRRVVRGVDTRHIQEYPPRLAVTSQPPRKRPRFSLTGGVLTEQMPETCLPSPPLPHRGALRAPRTQPLQRAGHTLSKTSHPYLHMLRQALSRAEQMSPAALPASLPGLLDQSPITDHDARPGGHEGPTRRLGAGGMDLAVGALRVRHPPQPGPVTRHEPGGRVAGMDSSTPCALPQRVVIGADRCGDPSPPRLDCPLAQRYAAARGPQGLPRTPAGPHAACHLAHKGREPWTIPAPLLGWQRGVAQRAARGALPLVEQPVRHLGTHDRQCQNLLRVRRAESHQALLATGTDV